MASYIDISIPTDHRTTVYPGDSPPAFYWPGWTHASGDPANVGFFNGGLHHGTHVDAPWHFIRNGKRLHEISLNKWLGPCLVIDCTNAYECISESFLQKVEIPSGIKKVIFKTQNSLVEYWNEPWNPKFVYLHNSAAKWCIEHGIETVGFDYLTIDPPHEVSFPAHHTLLSNDVGILENLRLSHVSPGLYELIAPPINLIGVDGGWTRAILRLDK